jgi:hypothetical protein
MYELDDATKAVGIRKNINRTVRNIVQQAKLPHQQLHFWNLIVEKPITSTYLPLFLPLSQQNCLLQQLQQTINIQRKRRKYKKPIIIAHTTATEKTTTRITIVAIVVLKENNSK